MVALLITIELHVIRNHLLLGNVFENQEIGLVLIVEVIRS